MTDFIQGLIHNGEELKSIHILLETHWPELAGLVELGWLEYLARQGKPEELIEDQEHAADLGRRKYGVMTRGGDDQTTRTIIDYDATPSEWDLGVLRDLCHAYKLQHAKKAKEHVKEGVISRVKAEWCCRCKKMTDFFEENCVTQYCQHKRCHYCRDFNKARGAETGQRVRRGD